MVFIENNCCRASQNPPSIVIQPREKKLHQQNPFTKELFDEVSPLHNLPERTERCSGSIHYRNSEPTNITQSYCVAFKLLSVLLIRLIKL
jgi:hypothetical protein